ncbi:MAG: helix-turn-helix domain-containing protein [Clostridium sp.]|jgi:transcriptional regulator with XRE-family HTH domain|uniref:helix-turn-helix domain-containing protein n=1 Tax=Clostridium sp. TaxID=1506 RepID=UPI0025BE15CF|nr:helix-turn-helix transcriptional regulator [Clostridium sp.]MCH3965470.1 helix-turn-helix domain-containing protein [Clostridium sp.]MCI2202802.1 helix-turn-helix domain-containing protein [Clostridium sp.]
MESNVKKINLIRIKQGMSVTELAEKSKLAKATVSRILNNKACARPDTIGKLAKALNVDVEQIVDFK